MTKAQQEINFQIADNLKGYNKELEFKYNDNSCSFNVLDGKGTGKGYRHICHCNEEDEKVPLDGVEPEETLNTEVSAASFNGDGYAFLTGNIIDIPLLHAWGVSYLATCNDAIISDYVQELENTQVIYTSKSDADIEVIRNFFDLGIQIIKVDFDGICPGYSEEDPLVTVAEKIQETGKDGIDVINKFMHKTFRGYMDKTTVKSPDVSDISDSQVASNNISIGLENNTTETGAETEAETNVGVIEQKNIKSLPIDKLINDKKYQSRVSEDKSAIAELAAAYKAGEDIAPLEVVDTGNGTYIITDGHHRYAGAKIAEMDHIRCHITRGTKLDAFKLSLGANESNKALKRTNADKRNAVETALDSKEFCSNTNRQIATICKVSSTFVDNIVKKQKESDDTVQESANVCTQEKNDIDTDTVINIPQSITSSRTKVKQKQSKIKAITEKVTNEHISLSVTWKSKPISGETIHGLLTDLQGIIDDYISDFKEAI